MTDSLKASPATITIAVDELPEMLEIMQLLEPLWNLDPAKLPPRLRELLEQDTDTEVDISPRELVDLLKETDLPEETIQEAAALAEQAEQARALEQQARDLLKRAQEIAESVKERRAQSEAAPSATGIGGEPQAADGAGGSAAEC